MAAESTTDSKGQVLLKTYKYSMGFPYPTSPLCSSTLTTNCYPRYSGDPLTLTLRRMVSQNMIGLPIETATYRGGKRLQTMVQTYVQTGPGAIKPYQYFETETAEPLAYPFESLYYPAPLSPIQTTSEWTRY